MLKNRLNNYIKSVEQSSNGDRITGNFINSWNQIEKLLATQYTDDSAFTAYKAIEQIKDVKLRNKLNVFRKLRNEVAHGVLPYQQLNRELQELDFLTIQLKEYLSNNK